MVKPKRKLRKQIKIGLLVIGLILIYCIIPKNFLNKQNDKVMDVIKLEKESKAELFEENTYLTLQDYIEINPYVFALLRFNDQGILRSIPVVESKSEAHGDYWMNHNVFGEIDTLGTAFLDETTPLDSSNNLRINGHASYNDSRMFTFLQKYKDIDYFNQNLTFEMETMFATHTYEVICISIVNVEEDRAYDASWLNENLNSQQVKRWMQLDASTIVNQQNNTNIHNGPYITLVTCDMENKDERYIIFAQEKKEGN